CFLLGEAGSVDAFEACEKLPALLQVVFDCLLREVVELVVPTLVPEDRSIDGAVAKCVLPLLGEEIVQRFSAAFEVSLRGGCERVGHEQGKQQRQPPQGSHELTLPFDRKSPSHYKLVARLTWRKMIQSSAPPASICYLGSGWLSSIAETKSPEKIMVADGAKFSGGGIIRVES